MSNLYNMESEAYVIGAMMVEQFDTNSVYGRLTTDDIYGEDNRKLFKALEHGFNTGTGCDQLSVLDYVEDMFNLNLGKLSSDLVNNAVGTKNIDSHINRILACSNSRGMQKLLIKSLSDLQGGRSSQENLQAIQGEISGLRTDTGYGVTHYTSMEETWEELLTELETRMDPDTPAGLTTGIHELDEILGARGLQPKDMVIIGARPAGGKTMVAGKIALHIALNLNRPTLIFSLEMGKTSLMQRFISQGSRLSADTFYDGNKIDDDFGRIQQAVIPLNKSPLYIDDRSSLTFSDLASSARQFKESFPDVAMIMIDYIMLLKVEANGKRQDQAYGDVSLALLALGKELGVTMVILSQCNKSCESRNDKRPIASDLKEISQLEADATHVFMLFNESAYVDDTPMGKVIEIIVRKHRFGGLGTAHQEILGGWMADIQKDELCRRRDRCEMQNKKKDLDNNWNG